MDPLDPILDTRPDSGGHSGNPPVISMAGIEAAAGGLSLFLSMHTNVYIDAFNLYYRALRGTPHRWLDLRALALGLLGSAVHAPPHSLLHGANQGSPERSAKHIRQQTYFRALRTLPALSIHEGHFLSNPVLMPLADPQPGDQERVRVIRTEEKGSDANLAAYLTRDAAKRDGQAAFVITGDSDFAGAIRMVRRDFNFPVYVVDPKETVSRRLRRPPPATSSQLPGSGAASPVPVPRHAFGRPRNHHAAAVVGLMAPRWLHTA